MASFMLETYRGHFMHVCCAWNRLDQWSQRHESSSLFDRIYHIVSTFESNCRHGTDCCYLSRRVRFVEAPPLHTSVWIGSRNDFERACRIKQNSSRTLTSAWLAFVRIASGEAIAPIDLAASHPIVGSSKRLYRRPAKSMANWCLRTSKALEIWQPGICKDKVAVTKQNSYPGPRFNRPQTSTNGRLRIQYFSRPIIIQIFCQK